MRNALCILILGVACSQPAAPPAVVAQPVTHAKADAGAAAPTTTQGPSVSRSGQVQFRAKVESVTSLADFAGVAKPVHFDPRFAVVVRVDSVTPSGLGIDANSEQAFLIHSPSKLFMTSAASAVGNVFEFSIERTLEAGKVRWSRLEVR